MCWAFMCLFSKVQQHPLQVPPTLHFWGICSAARWGDRCGKTELDAKEMVEMPFLRELDHVSYYSSLKFIPGLCWHNLKFPSVLHILPTERLDSTWDTLWRAAFKVWNHNGVKATWYSFVEFIVLHVYHLFEHMRRGRRLYCSVLNFVAPRTEFITNTHSISEWLSQVSWAAFWGCILTLLVVVVQIKS